MRPRRIRRASTPPVPHPDNTIRGWDFSRADMAAALAGDRLLNPSLDLGNQCSLNCLYCYVEDGKSTRKVRHPDELSSQELSSVIADLAAAGARTVNIVGAGEPTMDPRFEDVIAQITGRGMRAIVFTNGTRLAERPALIDFLYQTGVSVVLKFDSTNGGLQDVVAGRRGYAAKRDRALEDLVDAGFAAERPTRLGLDVVVCKGNLLEVPNIHRECRVRGYYPIIADFIPSGRTEGGLLADLPEHVADMELPPELASDILRPLTPRERRWLLCELAAIDREFGIARAASPAYYSGALCTQLMGVYVDVRGGIWPCVAKACLGQRLPGIRQPLGTVRDGSLASGIWSHDPAMAAIRHSYSGACPFKASLRLRGGGSKAETGAPLARRRRDTPTGLRTRGSEEHPGGS